jgi:class 3 adenylate cyclase
MLNISNSRAEFQRLLQARLEHPERRSEIDQTIHAWFDRDCAIFVLDLSGFSRLTQRCGIIHFLEMIYHMTAIASPLIHQQGGTVIKQEADNLFALFAQVQPAIDAAVDILKAFSVVNFGLPDDRDLYAEIGIGYGTTLVIGEEDIFGCEVNLASKLGEDVARRGEILLTEAAFQQLSAVQSEQWERLVLTVSEMEMIAYKFKLAPLL